MTDPARVTCLPPCSSDCPFSPETIVVPVSGLRCRTIPHLLGLRSNPNPCRGLATPRPQAHRMDAPITRRQAQPGGSTGMPAAAPLASVAHHRRPGARHSPRAPPHTCTQQAAHSQADRSQGLILLPYTHPAAGPTHRLAGAGSRTRPQRACKPYTMLTGLVLPGMTQAPAKIRPARHRQRRAAAHARAAKAPVHTSKAHNERARSRQGSTIRTRNQTPKYCRMCSASAAPRLPRAAACPHPCAIQGLGQTCARRARSRAQRPQISWGCMQGQRGAAAVLGARQRGCGSHGARRAAPAWRAGVTEVTVTSLK